MLTSADSTPGSHSVAIDSVDITGLPSDEEFSLVATISNATESSTRGFGHGLFADSDGTWRLYGSDRNELLEIGPQGVSAYFFEGNHRVELQSQDYASAGGQPTDVRAQLKGGDDSVDYLHALGGMVRVAGGTGDDHYSLAVQASLTIQEDTGFDTLSLPTAYLTGFTSGQSLDLSSGAEQTLEISAYGSPIGERNITIVGGEGVEFAGASGVSIHGRGYDPEPIMVDSLASDFDGDLGAGKLELREAIELANRIAGEHTIEFAESLFALGKQTIAVGDSPLGPGTAVPLFVDDDLTINGPGQDLLSIDGEEQARVFTVNSASITLRDLSVERGNTVGDGGGLSISNGEALLERVAFRDNETHIAGKGGAINAYQSPLTIVDSTLDGNESKYGGAVRFTNTTAGHHLTIRGTTISRNTAWTNSSGVSVYGYSSTHIPVLIENSTFYANSANQGGALYIAGRNTSHSTASGFDVDIVNSTFAENEATQGWTAGIFNFSSAGVELHNTIVAQSVTLGYGGYDQTYDIRAASGLQNTITGSHNLVGFHYATSLDFSAPTAGNIDLDLAAGETAGLLQLGHYGGPTETVALAPDSPAVNTGDAALAVTTDGVTPIAIDQRGEGYARVLGAAIDIGAYETNIERRDDLEGVDSLFVVGGAGDDDIIVTESEIYPAGIEGDSVPFNPAGFRVYVQGGDGDDTLTVLLAIAELTLEGEDGNDRLFGSSGVETLDGGSGDDELYGGGGNDQLRGGPGEDTLYGGAGADSLHGGEGSDRLFGGDDADVLYGDAGDDALDGGVGADWLYGGPDDDTLVDEDAGDSSGPMYGGAGDDTFIVQQSASTPQVHVGTADDADTLVFSEWTEGITLNAALRDVPQPVDAGGATLLTILGTASVGFIIGTPSDDSITGDGGANRIEGRGGSDMLNGGGGDDTLFGGSGGDSLFAYGGNSILDGGYGDDEYAVTDAFGDTTLTLRDADGLDTVLPDSSWMGASGVTIDLGDFGLQTISTEVANVAIDLPGDYAIENAHGTSGPDVLRGGEGANRLEGSGGDDTFFSGPEDVVLGGDGIDSIEARSGADAMFYDTGGALMASPAPSGEGFNGEQRSLASGYAEWSFGSLPAGDYVISAAWAPVTSGTTMFADYEVYAGSPAVLTTTAANVGQNADPDGDLRVGRTWQPLGDVVQVSAGETITVRVSPSGADAILVDAISIERQVYALSAEAANGGLPVTEWTADGTGAYPVVELTAVRADDASAVSIASVEALGPLASDALVLDSAGVWMASLSPTAGLADGSYPVMFRVEDGIGGVGNVTLLATVGVPNSAPTLMGIPTGLSAAEHVEVSFTFTVDDPGGSPADLSFDFGPGAPASLVAAHAESSAITPSGSSYQFTWTPTEEDDGEHMITLRVRDSGETPIRHAVTIPVTVAEQDAPAYVDAGSLGFAYNETSAGERADPSVVATVSNDGPLQGVRVLVDWTYEPSFDGSTFDPDETFLIEDFADVTDASRTLLLSPSYATYFGDAPWSPTSVALKVQELDPVAGEYVSEQHVVADPTSGANVTVDRLHATGLYTPVDTTNAEIDGFELKLPLSPDVSTDLTVFGRFDNPDGPVEGVEINLFQVEPDPNTDDYWLGIAVTDAMGNFEFTPRDAVDLADFSQDQTVTIRAEAYDSIPTLAPPTPATTAGLAEASREVTLRVPKLPKISDLTYDDSPTLEGFGIVRQPKITGRLNPSPTHTDVSEVVIAFDYDGNGAVDGITITEADGAFEYYPEGLQDGGNYNGTAWAVIWDEFRRLEIPHSLADDTEQSLSFVVGAPSATTGLPAVSGFQHTHGPGPDVYVPTVEGRVEDANGGGMPDVVVEVSVVQAGSGATPFDEHYAEVMTDESGAFEFTPFDLVTGETYSIHARTVGWDPVAQLLDVGPTAEIASVTVDGDPPAPVLSALRIAHDTGIDDDDDVTSDPTLTGSVNYAGDLSLVEIEFDLDGDGVADAVTLPDEHGTFYYTPTGLVDGEAITVTAWAVVPDFGGSPPVFDPAFSVAHFEPTVNEEEIAWSSAQTETAADEWFEDLFSPDDDFGGAWYEANFTPDTDAGLKSSPLTANVTLELATDPNQPNGQLSILGLGRPALATAHDPTLEGLVVSDGSVDGLLIEFSFVETVEGVEHEQRDGEVRTDASGRFLYTPQSHSISSNHLRVKVHEPIYGSTETRVTTLDFADPYVLSPLTADPALSSLVLTLDAPADERVVFNGHVMIGEVGAAGRTVEFDLNNDGRQDGIAFTDALGGFEYAPAEWVGATSGVLTVRARVVGEEWNDETLSVYRTLGEWSEVTWTPTVNTAPSIALLELANDTGYYDLDDNGSVDTGDYEYRVLDRVTSDPTVVGLVVDAPPYAIVEFSHRGDEVVDGTATADENGAFRYRPEGLDYGYWNLHARVRENDPLTNHPVTGSTLDSGWQPITASGDPADPNASATGFTLVAPSAAVVTDVQLANPADPGADQFDPRLRFTIQETDSLENVVVDFYEEDAFGERTYLGSSRPQADGAATFMPLGVSTGVAREIVAVPREQDPTSGLDLLGESFTFNSNGSVTFVKETALNAAFPARLYTDGLGDFSAAVYGDVQTMVTTVGDIDIELISPQYVEIRVTHWSTAQSVALETVVERVSVVAQQQTTGSGATVEVDHVYRYSYTPDMTPWADAIAGGDEIRVEARAVGVDASGGYVLGDWSSASTISGFNYEPSSRSELGVALQLFEPLAPEDEGQLDATTTYESTSLRLFGSVSQSLGDEVAGQDWRESLAVTARSIEFDYYVDGSPDGVVDLVVPIDDPGYFEAELEALPFGETLTRVRLVEEIQIDREFVSQNADGTINDGEAYKDDLESGETTLVTGVWQEIRFTLTDPAPSIVEESLALQDPETTSSGSPGSVAPVVTGAITSSLTDDLGGFLIEFDHNGDSFADGTAFTYEDGSFEYEPLGLTHGETTIRVRGADLYGVGGAAYGQWVDFVFEYLPVPIPTLDGAPALETSDGLTSDGTSRALTPVIVGSVDAHEAITGLIIEIDYDDDGIADGSAVVRGEDASFRFADSIMPYGEIAPRVRPTGYRGAERIDGEWSDPLPFFHASADAPALTLALEDATTGEITGRATVGGYGVATLVEVVVVDAVGDEHSSFVSTDQSGAYSVIPTRVSNAAQEIRARGVDARTGASPIVGEWNRLDLVSQPLSLSAPGATSIDEFVIAHPIAGSSSVADPTIRGRLSGDVSTATVEFDYYGDGVADAEADVAADGSFHHTPVGLSPNTPYSIRARWTQWDPAAGVTRVSDSQDSGWDEWSTLTVTHDPTLAAAPYVDELSLDPPSPLGTTGAAFAGSVQGDVRLSGLTVWFDENGDGVAEGSAKTLDNGEFVYLSTTIQPSAGDQQLAAWVEPPTYLDAEAAPPHVLTFQLAATPSILTLTDDDGTVTGLIDWHSPGAAVVEYYFVGEEAGAAPSAPIPQDLSTPPEALDVQTTTVDSAGGFEIDATSHAAAMVTVYARAVAGVSGGPWRRLTLNLTQNSAALLPQEVKLAHDTGLFDDDNYSNDPKIRGRIGQPGEGAFGVVEFETRASSFDPFLPGGRATADARGAFSFTPEASPGFNEVRVRSVAWDPSLEQEVYSDWVEHDFWLVSDTNPAVLTLDWSQQPVGDEVSDATVIGAVTGLGRKAGVRVEFNHGDGASIDGFTYTDANGAFTYTPLGLTASQSTTLTVTARAVAWNEQDQQYERNDFSGADTASRKSISATLTQDSPTDITLGGESLVDLTNDALALAGFEDAVFSAIAHADLAGAAAETIAAPLGDFLLLHRGGGEDENEFDEAVFTAAANRPADETNDSGDVPINLATDAGGRLVGAFQIIVDVSSSGDTIFVDDYRFRLRIDDYQISTTNLYTDAASDVEAQTALTLIGEYEFVLATTGAHALYSGDTLLDAFHFVDEYVDYDYLITELAFDDDPSASGGEPIASDYAATGGSEYYLQIGVDAIGTDPAVPARYQSGADYAAPIRHSETNRGDGSGSGRGGASTTTTSGGESSNRDGDASVTTTYVETITKTGSFNGANSATGTIHVSIQETREETSTDTRVVQTDHEQSSETTHRTESYTRDYTGAATYTSGVSIVGSATLTETRGTTIVITGAGSSAVGLRTETWTYGGSIESSSTLTAAGTFFESLDPASPRNTSEVGGTYDASFNADWEGAGTTALALPPSGDGERSDVSGTFSSTNAATLSETFRIEDVDGHRRAEGSYTINSSGNNRETSEGSFAEGLVGGSAPTNPINPGAPVGDYTNVNFRTLVTGSASGETATDYISIDDPVDGAAIRETTDYSVEARGTSFTATQTVGWTDDGEDLVAYTDRSASSARVTLDSSGVAVTGFGRIDGAEVDTSRDGVSRETTALRASSFSNVWDGVQRSQTLRTHQEAIAQLYTYQGDDVSGADRRFSKSTVVSIGGGGGSSSSGSGESSRSSRSAFSRSGDGGGDSQSGSYENSDSGRSGFSTSSRDSGPGYSSWGSLKTSSSSSSESSGSYSGGDFSSSSETSGSASLKSSGGSSSSGGGSSSTSQGSSDASERTKSNSSSSNGRADSSSSRKADGSSKGSGHSASSSHSGGVTTSRSSSGSSKSNGGTEVSSDSSSGGSQEVNSSANGGGSSNSRGRYAAFGGGGGLRVISSSGGAGGGSASGSASLAPDGVLSFDTSFGERSGGAGTTGWSQWSNAGMGSGRSSGSSATRAMLTGSGSNNGDGLSGSASESSGGASSAGGSSFSASFGPGTFTLIRTNTAENASGNSGRSASVSGGEATGGDSSSRNGGKTKNFTTRVTLSIDGVGYDSQTYTATSNSSDGSFGGTETLDRSGVSQSSGHTFAETEYDRTTTQSRSNSEYSSLNSETVSHTPDGSSGLTSSISTFSSDEMTYTRVVGYDESDYNDPATSVSTETTYSNTHASSSSSYSSSHQNGEHGATGGRFTISGAAASRSKSGFEHDFGNGHGWIEATSSNSGSTWEESGTYDDTANGRQESGEATRESSSRSSWDELIYGSDEWGHGEAYSYDYSASRGETNVEYGPGRLSVSSDMASHSRVGYDSQGVTYTEIGDFGYGDVSDRWTTKENGKTSYGWSTAVWNDLPGVQHVPLTTDGDTDDVGQARPASYSGSGGHSPGSVSLGVKGHSAPRGEAPGGWSLYWHYLTNPSDMDSDLETGFYVSGGIGVGAAAGAAALAAGGAIVTEVVDAALEELASSALGVPVVIPLSPVDLIQDGAKSVLRQAGKEAVEDSAGAAAKLGGKGATKVETSQQWRSGRYTTRASQPGAYQASGRQVFPTRRNSGLSGTELRAEQEAFALRRLQEGHPAQVIRGQAGEAGLTTLDRNARLADRGAESALRRAIDAFQEGN